ncbi:MAG: 50S ribosomal protein L25 [Candidatus Saccharimonadales bacterium]
MQDVVLQAKLRQATGKAVAGLRREGLIPGVVYGQGGDAQVIAAYGVELSKVYNRAGTNRLIQLKIDDKKTALNTLFVDVQHDPVSGALMHFDLYTVKMDEEIETEIPIHFEGTAPATYNHDGILVQNLESIEVKALPNKLPESFTVDLEQLEEINAAVHVSDITIPEGVELLSDPEELIVKIDPPRSEEELEELDEAIAADAEEQVASEHGAPDESDDEEGEDDKPTLEKEDE